MSTWTSVPLRDSGISWPLDYGRSWLGCGSGRCEVSILWRLGHSKVAWVIPRWWRWVIPFHGVVRRGHPNPSLALILESPLHLRGGLKCFATRVMQFYSRAFEAFIKGPSQLRTSCRSDCKVAYPLPIISTHRRIPSQDHPHQS